MIISKLKLDEEHELDFSLNIYGTADQAKSVRFVVEGEGYSVVFPGEYANGNVKVRIPKMKNILPSGVHECRMEVVVGDKFFSPLRESVEFEPLIEVNASTTKVEKVKEEVVVEHVKLTSKSTTPTKIEEAKSLGYEIVEYAGSNVLKKDNEYCGFVTETKLILANDRYSTVTELVDSFSRQ